MSLLLLSLYLFAGNPNISVALTYQNPEEVKKDTYLVRPADVDYSSDGRMYIADKTQHKVFVWGKDGKFIKSFSRKGQGPGEMGPPNSIAVHNGEVWVNQQTRQVSIFDLDGNFKRSFQLKWQTKNLIPFGNDKVLAGVLTPTSGNMQMEFYLLNQKGKKLKLLKNFENSTELTKEGPNGEISLKAFTADIDIQQDLKGDTYFGFSYTKKLYRLTKEGEIAREYHFDFLDQKPNAQEKEDFMNMTFPMEDGTRLAIKNIPKMAFSFAHNKAYYTQFTLKENKVLFVLTPIGSTGMGLAYCWGSYYICDKDKGKVLSFGGFRYSDDSLLFTRSGRVLGVIVDDSGDYKIQEMSLKGF